MKLLIVDDSTMLRDMLSYALSEGGYTDVVESIDGLDGLSKAKETQFDLIISDVNMPNMDGFELIKNIRKTADADGIPIFLLTTEFSFAKKIKAKELKINGWIQKPYNSKHFIKTITKALN